jgi:hypothetical protein
MKGPSNMRKILGIGAVALVCLSVCATAALAVALPTFKSDLIVPNQSLAGVKLKSTYKEAVKAFSSGAKGCSTTKGCSWASAGGPSFSIVFARLTTKGKPIVAEISIRAGESSTGKPVYSGPLLALKTSSGIGLGSSASAVKHAYPHATGGPSRGGYVVKGSGERATNFQIEDGHVAGIAMQGVHLG